jgi:hypothetical protein
LAVKLVVTARRRLDCLRETDKGKYAYVCVCVCMLVRENSAAIQNETRVYLGTLVGHTTHRYHAKASVPQDPNLETIAHKH